MNLRFKFEVLPRGPSGVEKSRILFGKNGIISKMVINRLAHAYIMEVYLSAFPYEWSMKEAFKKKSITEYYSDGCFSI